MKTAINLSAVWFTLLLMAAAIPMALRRVPPNGFYGFRTPKTMSSPEVWYQANFHAGVNLLLACAVTLLVIGVVAAISGAARANVVRLPLMVTMVLVSLGVSFVQLHRM